MSLLRLTARVPSAKRLGMYRLKAHQLHYDKRSEDGSGKCNALYTNNHDDVIFGAVFDIDANEKAALDKVEGLGRGYEIKMVQVFNNAGEMLEAFTYYATDIKPLLKPYAWYLNHVIIGAQETKVPTDYLEAIQSTEHIDDADTARDAKERAIYQDS